MEFNFTLVLGDSKGRGTVSCVTSEDSPKGVGLNGSRLAGHYGSYKLYQGALLPVGFIKPQAVWSGATCGVRVLEVAARSNHRVFR